MFEPLIPRARMIVPLVVAFICGTAAAQSSDGKAQTTTPQTQADAGGNNVPALQERHPHYRVMPSDVLAVTFPLSPELNQNVTVQPDGYIALANVGSIYVQGETTPEIIDALNRAYGKVLHNPIIAVDLTNFQHPEFIVTGQVAKPGRYELREDTTVSEAIAIGGGLSSSAKSQVFVLHRVSADWVEVKKLDVKKVMTGKKANEDIHLQRGDLVFVPDKFITRFRRYVPYSLGLGTGLGFNGDALVNGNL